jgi:hypothetical protein
MKLGHAALTYTLNMSKDMQHGYVTYVVLYRWDGIVFPSQNNNIILYLFGVLQTMCNYKFLTVRRSALMTHREFRVDRPFPVT